MGTTNPTRVAQSQFSGTNQFTNIVSEYWEKELLRYFDPNFVFKQLVNFKYEKKIKLNDTIHIRKAGDGPTPKAYSRNQTLVPELMTDTKVTFTIDQQKYWMIELDDLDDADIDVDILGAYIKRAAIKMASTVDTYVEGLITAGADSDNAMGSSGSPIALSPANVYEKLVEFNVKLVKTNTLAPGQNPKLVAPPDLIGIMRLSPVTTHSTALGDKTVAKGNGDKVLEFAGFDVIQARKVEADESGNFSIIASTNQEAVTYANKVSKFKKVDLAAARKFAQGVMALYFYGGKVIYPEMLGVMTATVSYTDPDSKEGLN